MHYTTERYYIMTVNRKVSGLNLPATYWQPGALQHQGTVEKVNLAHSFQQGGNREGRRKWSDQDPTTGGGYSWTQAPLWLLCPERRDSVFQPKASYLPPSHIFKPPRLPKLFPTVYNYSCRFAEGVRLCMHKNTCPEDWKPLMSDF